jgi:hypothetical protein
LLAEHCEVNAVNNVGQTALMMAARFGRTDIVRLLIAHGASAALKDQAGNTAIGPATRQSRDSGASRRRVMPFANGSRGSGTTIAGRLPGRDRESYPLPKARGRWKRVWK